MAHAGLQHVRMDLEQRKLLPHAFGLFQHEMHVLEVLGDPTLGRKLAADEMKKITGGMNIPGLM